VVLGDVEAQLGQPRGARGRHLRIGELHLRRRDARFIAHPKRKANRLLQRER
jgi:hypothetical protein